jgi:hypothetical protein
LFVVGLTRNLFVLSYTHIIIHTFLIILLLGTAEIIAARTFTGWITFLAIFLNNNFSLWIFPCYFSKEKKFHRIFIFQSKYRSIFNKINKKFFCENFYSTFFFPNWVMTSAFDSRLMNKSSIYASWKIIKQPLQFRRSFHYNGIANV